MPVSDGHMAACFVSFKGEKPSVEQIKADWAAFSGRAQGIELPSAPKQFLHYFEEPDRPQTKLDRMIEGGMAVSIGRLRPDTQYDYKFVCLSHNTLRGAAGGAVLLAELLCAEGYIKEISPKGSDSLKDPVFEGVATAIVTPFNQGTIDFPVMNRLLDLQLAAGVDAIVVCGTTGEASTMTDNENSRSSRTRSNIAPDDARSSPVPVQERHGSLTAVEPCRCV